MKKWKDVSRGERFFFIVSVALIIIGNVLLFVIPKYWVLCEVISGIGIGYFIDIPIDRYYKKKAEKKKQKEQEQAK